MSTNITTLPLGTARRRLLATLLLSLALTACGGGGGEQSSLPAEQVTPDSTDADGGQTTVGAEQPVDEPVNATPDDSSSSAGGQAAAGDPSSSVSGPSMPGGGADTGTTVADEATQLPVADSGGNDLTSPVIDDGGVADLTSPVIDDGGVADLTSPVIDGGDVADLTSPVGSADDQTSPVADTVPQQPTDVDDDIPAAGEVVAGEADDVDQLFGDNDEQTAVAEDGESAVVADDASSDVGEELVTDSDDLPPLDDESQPAATDGAITEDALIAEQQPVTEDLGDLFGNGGEVASAQAVTQSQIAPRELRWALPSKRMDGSALGRQEVKAIELWGGLAHQPLRRWATLPPTAQYYGLAQVPKGVYRFAMVTIDQDGLRSDMSAAVIRDLR